MRTGSLGEITRAGSAFSAEVRGLAHYLNQPKGRLYQYTCDADLGDARCGVDLSLARSPRHRDRHRRSSTHARSPSPALPRFAADTFTRGLAAFTSGANADQRIEIRRHTLAGSTVTLELWQPRRTSPLVGDTLTVTAGCDKHFDTCRDPFANAAELPRLSPHARQRLRDRHRPLDRRQRWQHHR